MKKLTLSLAAFSLLVAYACISTLRTERLSARVARLEKIADILAKQTADKPDGRGDDRSNALEKRVTDIESLLHENIVHGRLDPPSNAIRDYPDAPPRFRP
jgi:hypothetical protein